MPIDLMVKFVPEDKIMIVRESFRGTYEEACAIVRKYGRSPKFRPEFIEIDIYVGTCQWIIERLNLMKDLINGEYYHFLMTKLIPPFMHTYHENPDVDYYLLTEFNINGFCALPPSICNQIYETAKKFDISSLKLPFEVTFESEKSPHFNKWRDFRGSTFQDFSGIINLCQDYVKEAVDSNYYLVTYMNQ
jgi:hypothetical protein